MARLERRTTTAAALIAGFLAGAVVAVSVGVLAQAPEPGGIAPGSGVRRVVTRLDDAGKAVVLFDDRIALSKVRPPNGLADIWATTRAPAELSAKEDKALAIKGLMPPPGGTSFRVIEFPPDGPNVMQLDINTMMKVAGAGAPAKGQPPRHPMMHRTRTVDYALVLSGEIDMLLDDSEVHLKTGDVVVQQATNHAWANRGKAPARVAFILMASDEP